VKISCNNWVKSGDMGYSVIKGSFSNTQSVWPLKPSTRTTSTGQRCSQHNNL